MRVLICGGRDYNDNLILSSWLYMLHKEHNFSILINGGAAGADELADKWARVWNIKVLCYFAQWKLYGKFAGIKRNTQMLIEGKPELVVAFPGGRGTANMIKQSREHRIQVITVHPVL